MSKNVILLCVVLVASAVDVSGTKDQLISLQKRLESYFATEIDKLEEKYNTTKTIVNENSRKVFAGENPIYLKASDDVYAIMSKVLNETLELVMQTMDSDTTDCEEIVSIISVNADIFLTNVYRCTDYIVGDADGHLSNMETTYEQLHSGLIDRRNRIAACRYKFNETEEVDRAILCIETIENETRLLIAESVPALFAKIDEVNNILPTLITSLANCLNGYAVLQTSAEQLTNWAKKCYQQKISGR